MRCERGSFPHTAGCYASPTAATSIPRSPLPAPNLTFAPTLLPFTPCELWGSGPCAAVPHVNPCQHCPAMQGTCGTEIGAGGSSMCQMDPQPWCGGEVPSLPHGQLPGRAMQVALGHGQGTAMARAAPAGMEHPELSPTAAQSCSPTAAPCCPQHAKQSPAACSISIVQKPSLCCSKRKREGEIWVREERTFLTNSKCAPQAEMGKSRMGARAAPTPTPARGDTASHHREHRWP